MKKINAISTGILVLFLIGFVFAETLDTNETIIEGPTVNTTPVKNTSSVEAVQECVPKIVQELNVTYGTCYLENICDPSNLTCVSPMPYSCINSTQMVDKTISDCTVTGLKIHDKFFIPMNDYSCSAIDSDSVMCDSKYDGNGDGICTSGESCMKFIAVDDTLQKYQKNSKDEFVAEDRSYFLTPIITEVLQ